MLTKKELSQIKSLASKGVSTQVCIGIIVHMVLKKCRDKNILTTDQQANAIAISITKFLYQDSE